MSKNILHTACLESYRPRKDKSYTITFSTNTELSPEQVMKIVELYNKMGMLYFVEKDTITVEELAELDKVDIELEKRSYSQRLRAVLFVLHQQLGGNNDNFKPFYEQKMEAIITQIKSKLD